MDTLDWTSTDYRTVLITSIIGLFIFRAIWRYLSSPSIRSYFRGPSKEVKHYRAEIQKLKKRLSKANKALSSKVGPYADEIKTLLVKQEKDRKAIANLEKKVRMSESEVRIIMKK